MLILLSPLYLSSNFYYQILRIIFIVFWAGLLYYLFPNLILIFHCFYLSPAFVLPCNANFIIFINLKYCLKHSPFDCRVQYYKPMLRLKILISKLFNQCSLLSNMLNNFQNLLISALYHFLTYLFGGSKEKLAFLLQWQSVFY